MPYTDHYSIEEFGLIEGVRACYRRTGRQLAAGNYESHQPCTHPHLGKSTLPVGRYEIGFSGVNADLLTSRYAYAMKVLEAAHGRTLAHYPDWLEHEWVLQEPGWRRVVFTSPRRREAEEYCDRLMREIANSGEITVTECVTVESDDGRKRMLVIRDIPEFDKTAVDAIVNGETPAIGDAALRFGYDEIAMHIVRLDERMLSLLNAEDSRPPLTAADRELLDAAGDLDLERIQRAVRDGANVNALDDGESVLTCAVQACPWNHFMVDADYDRKRAETPDYPLERRIGVADWLLQHGADINLFGFEGLAPLSAAVLRHEPELVRQLLRRGADPTSDQFPEEHTSPEPTACYYAGGDLHVVDEGSEEYVDVWEINVLIDAAILERQVSQGRSIHDAMIVPGSTQRWVSRVDAAYLVGLMWNHLDVDLLAPYVSDDVVYESQHVMEPLRGKDAVMEYLRSKMQTFRQHCGDAKAFAEIAVSGQGPCVILGQGHPEALVATVLVQVREGAISRIDVCGIVPAPVTVRATGIIPR